MPVGLEHLFLLERVCRRAVFSILVLIGCCHPTDVLPEASFLAQLSGSLPASRSGLWEKL